MSSVKIGTVRKTIKGNLILVLGKGITVMKDGEKVNIDEKYKTLSLFDSKEGVGTLLSKGIIDQEEATNRLEYITDKNISKDLVAFTE